MPDHAKKLGEYAEFLNGEARYENETGGGHAGRFQSLAAVLESLGPVVEAIEIEMEPIRRLNLSYAAMQFSRSDAEALLAAVEGLR